MGTAICSAILVSHTHFSKHMLWSAACRHAPGEYVSILWVPRCSTHLLGYWITCYSDTMTKRNTFVYFDYIFLCILIAKESYAVHNLSLHFRSRCFGRKIEWYRLDYQKLNLHKHGVWNLSTHIQSNKVAAAINSRSFKTKCVHSMPIRIEIS